MTLTRISLRTALGLKRFGLGAGPGDIDKIGGGIRDVLVSEIESPAAMLSGGTTLLSSADAFRRWRSDQDEIKAMRMAQPASEVGAGNGTAPSADVKSRASEPAMSPKMKPDAKLARRDFLKELTAAEIEARQTAILQAPTGFSERCAAFWSNHFAVSIRKSGAVHALVAGYEREAIRPHIFAKFSDMLLAVETHPAMLAYLDNDQSTGPNSKGGQRQHKGRNENLAREILELHTLGVNGGYGQADVTALANILTGWRFARKENEKAEEGTFLFAENLHEPGDHKLLDLVYRDGGIAQGEAALRALANHPSTARHIATKLAVHFVSDAPDPKLVERLERKFKETDGDLREVCRVLIQAPEAWTEAETKIRTPYEFLAAFLRATAIDMKPQQISGALSDMGQPLWSPPGPNGFPDQSAAWASPEGMKARLDFSARFSQLIQGSAKPTDILDSIMGASASVETRNTVARAQTRQQGFALLMMSPEFQRR